MTQQTIKDAANSYESKQTKNISEVEVVRTDMELREEVFKEGTPDEFKVNITTIDGQEYRIPDSVLKSLKSILESKPNLKTFQVKKTGTGMNTSYIVVPLD
jgi:hypothetical protein